MNKASLSDINIYDVGNELQLAGTILSGKNRQFILTLPEKEEEFNNLSVLPLNLEEWNTLFKQMDTLETEIFTEDDRGQWVKKIFRKTARQIDNYQQWACFKRDNYSCRYCGRDGIPMSVDHVDLWEEGGVAIIENLITACRQCNKDRGRMHYEDWLKSPVYVKKSISLPEVIKQQNIAVLNTLDWLKSQRVQHVRSR